MKLVVSVLLFCVTHHTFVLSQSSTTDPQISTSDSDDTFIRLDNKACRFWPQVSKLPLECCLVPEFFEQKIKSKCISYCTRPEEASFNTNCCTTQCLLEDAEIVYDGKVNAENAKTFLAKLFENNGKIVKKLDSFIKKCEAKGGKPIHDETLTNECETPQYGIFLNCIHQKLFNTCPESKPDSECKEIKEFMEKCPNAKRRFKENKRASISPMKDSLAQAMKEVIDGKSS